MDKRNDKATILCMFSGGIDSSGVLHRLMTDEAYADHPLIVHHIHILNRENRANAEAKAVKAILSYYKSAAKRPFTVSGSTFNSTGFAPLKANRFPFDMDICAFLSANICAARKDIGFVAMGRTKTDVESGGANFMKRMQRAQAIFKSVLSLENGYSAEYIFPMVDFTKKEVWDFLPEEVRSNTWWCRRPVYSEDKKPEVCGKCHTCKEVNELIL
ncbi:hypothetical protein [Ekhidna sp.]|uniref:hypothetical protein n=1 Tax=Ekhidna sp. TaxID=2608089 RepID=UPI003CCB76B0